MTDNEGFASRWSRLKRAPDPVLEEPDDLEQAGRPSVEEATALPPDDTRPDEEILAELELPDPSTLQKGDDFRGFLRPAVPSHLRRIALRRLWRLDPTLANLDGLVDYGEDMTDAATVIKNMQTVYEVGRGMVKWVTETEEEPSDEGAVAPDLAELTPLPTEEPESEDTALEVSTPDDVTALPETIRPGTDFGNPQDAAEPLDAPRARRMAFHFATEPQDADETS